MSTWSHALSTIIVTALLEVAVAGSVSSSTPRGPVANVVNRDRLGSGAVSKAKVVERHHGFSNRSGDRMSLARRGRSSGSLLEAYSIQDGSGSSNDGEDEDPDEILKERHDALLHGEELTTGENVTLQDSLQQKRALLRRERMPSSDNAGFHSLTAAQIAGLEAEVLASATTNDALTALSKDKLAELEARARQAGEGEILEGFGSISKDASEPGDSEDGGDEQDRETKDVIRRERTEDDGSKEQLRKLQEKLAKAEKENKELQRIAEVAAEAVVVSMKQQKPTRTRLPAEVLSKHVQDVHASASDPQSLEEKTVDTPKSEAEEDVEIVTPLPATDEDPLRDLADGSSPEQGSLIESGRGNRTKAAPAPVPGMAELIETMSGMSSSDVMRLAREHRLDNYVKEKAAEKQSREKERLIRRQRLKNKNRAGFSKAFNDGPETPREIRNFAYKVERLCMSHNPKDHSIVFLKCEKSMSQQWYFKDDMLRNMNSSRCLTMQVSDKVATARVKRNDGLLVMKPCTDTPAKKWYIAGVLLKTKYDDDLCAEVMSPTEVKMVKCATEKVSRQNFFRAPARPCEWGPWNAWTPCTKTCGGGTQRRERVVVLEAEAQGEACMGDEFEVGRCGQNGCPIACKWDDWNVWNECSKTCGGGTRKKRRIVNIKAENGGKPCGGYSFLVEACKTKPCPIDCAWAAWQEWGECAVTCGGGQRTRERQILQQALFGGRDCPIVGMHALRGASKMLMGDEVESPKGQFGEWSKCKEGLKVIGIGKFALLDQVAPMSQNLISFECTVADNGCRVNCKGSACKFQSRCAVMGSGSTAVGSLVRSKADRWGPWSTCPDEDHQVIGIAKLFVMSPYDAMGLPNFNDFICNNTGCRVWCQASDCELQTMCGTKMTPSNGKPLRATKNQWSQYSKCPPEAMVAGLAQVTLLEPSAGMENLNRWECNENGCRVYCWGTDCMVMSRCIAQAEVAGVHEEVECGKRGCPIDCVMDEWTAWSTCTKSCESGIKNRERKPKVVPQNDGTPCGYLGLSDEVAVCNSQACPIDCLWSVWGEWDECSSSCGGGQRTRVRIKARLDRYDGAPCTGTYEESVKCGGLHCPVDCVLGAWAGWSGCSKECGGGGSRTRDRDIVVQVLHGGMQCEGGTTETDTECSRQPCPVDCELDVWTEWSACSRDCGKGTMSRFRTIAIPNLYNGKACPRDTREEKECLAQQDCENQEEEEAEKEGGG
eukprot:TRINITY_DN49555_c0_g1_i1.p1 TRINITY_DN49555_c0_g1~~TRINITY_DN49555_c0_g1_i1.p1  ORF type:complete len:1251 (-),score=254.10 TRINITY_DN49555_c0_g1_i1:107-3778(-)